MLKNSFHDCDVIIDLCGGTGSWSKPYEIAGYTVYNITLPEYDIFKFDINLKQLCFFSSKFDLDIIIPISRIKGVLAAPPCTQFSKANWRAKFVDRDFFEGMKCVRACLEIIWKIQSLGNKLEFWAIENPLGYLYNFLGKPAFYFQPWEFGETDFRSTKRTAIWGYFNQPVKTVKKRTVSFIRDPKIVKHGNLAWGSRSAADRAKTSSYFAEAFFHANH